MTIPKPPNGRFKRLYLTRHGQTVWNVENRMQGTSDSSLTPEGRLQVESLASRMQSIHIDCLYSSPSGRALDTSRILAGGRKIAVTPDARLSEIALGEWEGMAYDEIREKHPEAWKDYIYDPAGFIPVGNGERFEDVYRRASSFLADILSRPESNIIISTHGITLMAFLALFTNTSIRLFWTMPLMESACFCHVEYRNKWVIQAFNDVSHRGEPHQPRFLQQIVGALVDN